MQMVWEYHIRLDDKRMVPPDDFNAIVQKSHRIVSLENGIPVISYHSKKVSSPVPIEPAAVRHLYSHIIFGGLRFT